MGIEIVRRGWHRRNTILGSQPWLHQFFDCRAEQLDPIGVDLETDELAFFPFLYWPVTADQPLPSREAYAKLNNYLRTGGMIMFDTRDADTARFGSGSPEGRRLQAIARSLDIPPIEPIPSVRTRTRSP